MPAGARLTYESHQNILLCPREDAVTQIHNLSQVSYSDIHNCSVRFMQMNKYLLWMLTTFIGCKQTVFFLFLAFELCFLSSLNPHDAIFLRIELYDGVVQCVCVSITLLC